MPPLLIKSVIFAGRSPYVLFSFSFPFFKKFFSPLNGVSSLSLTSFNTNRVLLTNFSVVHLLNTVDSLRISSKLRFDEPGMTFRMEVRESADIIKVCVTPSM